MNVKPKEKKLGLPNSQHTVEPKVTLKEPAACHDKPTNTKNSFLRLKQVLEIFPVSRSHFYQGIQQGIYPKPIKPHARVSFWKKSDIELLIEESIQFSAGG